MLVSVIVPVRNEAAHIRQTLLDLAAQDFPKSEYEILVVDGLSNDGTAAIVREYCQSIPNLRMFHNPRRLASAARNVGVRYARGEYLVIVDGHCRVPNRDLLANMVDAFQSSGADTLGRPQPLRGNEPTPFQRAVAAARTSWLGHNPESHIYSDVAAFVPADNVAVAYRRDVFDLMGGFDESFDACEDVEFNTRVRQVGLTCCFTPAVAVEYQPRSTIRGFFRQMTRYGRGRARLGFKHPSTITAPSLIPSLWLVFLAIGGVAGLFVPPIAIGIAIALGTYLLVLLAESLRVWHATRNVALARLVFLLATIHIAFGWGYLCEVAAGLNRGAHRIGRTMFLSKSLVRGRLNSLSGRPPGLSALGRPGGLPHEENTLPE
ncbi:MAG TPA: glycosyltransferase [Gemmataceae bacterium]|nr:glycosyltransferase [Gemmataceae bacterium]